MSAPDAAVTDPSETRTAPSIVLVDPRAERRGPMRSVVEMAMGDGTVVAQVGTAQEAEVAVERSGAGVVVADVLVPLEDGLALVAGLRAAHPALLIVVCTFRQDAAVRAQVEAAGADAYLVKPISARDLRRVIEVGRRQVLAT